MNRSTALIILFFLIIFISFRVYIALNFSTSAEKTTSNTIEVPATYSGVLPCANCPGIDMTIVLNSDSATTITYYIDREDEEEIETEKWEQKSDTLKIGRPDQEDFRQFLIREDTLVALNRSGDRFESDNNSNIILTQNPEHRSIHEHHQRIKETKDVVWLASGNEPFWSIQKMDEHAVYATPDDEIELKLVKKSEEDSIDNFKFESDKLSISVTARKTFCRDTMSGFLFDQTVEIELNGETTYQGCGKYLR